MAETESQSILGHEETVTETVTDKDNVPKKEGKRGYKFRKPRVAIGIDRLGLALQMDVAGVPRTEIARALGVHKATVSKALAKFEPLFQGLREVRDFREVKADIIDATQLRLLQSLMSEEKHKKASLNQAAYAFDVLYKANRLERNQSTANVSQAFYSTPDLPE